MADELRSRFRQKDELIIPYTCVERPYLDFCCFRICTIGALQAHNLQDTDLSEYKDSGSGRAMLHKLIGDKDVRAFWGQPHLVVCALMCTSALAAMDSPGADRELHYLRYTHNSNMLESSYPRRRLQASQVELEIAYLTPDIPVISTLEPVSYRYVSL